MFWKKRNNTPPAQTAEEWIAASEDEELRARSTSNLGLGIVAAVLVAAVVITGLPQGSAGSQMAAHTELRSAQALRGEIQSLFQGTGTLEGAEKTPVELPTGVKILGYTVKNGDVIAPGQVLARVDTESVKRTVGELQRQMELLDEDLVWLEEQEQQQTLEAPADGRVMEIYGQAGQSLGEAVAKHGAVMVLSLDGTMTVRFERTAELAAGENVTVSTATEHWDGKIRQVAEDTVTVTIPDRSAKPGEIVTVEKDGTVLGTGTLEISSPLKVFGLWGKLEKITVEPGEQVEAGDTLAELTDGRARDEYYRLLQERKALEDQMARLTVLGLDGCVKAEQAGIVTGIPEDAEFLGTLEEPQVTGAAAASGGTVRLMMLTGAAPGESLPTENAPEPSWPEGYEWLENVELPDGVEWPELPEDFEWPELPDDFEWPDWSELPGGSQLPGAGMNDGVYGGKVTKVSYGALEFKLAEQDMTGAQIGAVTALADAAFTQTRVFAPALTVSVTSYLNGAALPGTVNQVTAGDRVLLTVEGGQLVGIVRTPGTGGSVIPGLGGQIPGDILDQILNGSFQIPSGYLGNMGSLGQIEPERTAGHYTVERKELCGILPNEIMKLKVSVDELEILSIQKGQKASIALDALPGQEFEGVVTALDPTGTNGGGNSKFTVTVELARTERMLEGMNARVEIQVGRTSGAVAVPAEAVYEEGSRVWVYTALDPETGMPTSPLEVKTGASDGKVIQILEGLEEGTTVYYSYAEQVVYEEGA